jgi:hypothetical protein
MTAAPFRLLYAKTEIADRSMQMNCQSQTVVAGYRIYMNPARRLPIPNNALTTRSEQYF